LAASISTDYQYYIQVQGCYRSPQGYAIVWINDVDMNWARKAITALEKFYKSKDPSIDTTDLFREASQINGVDSRDFCHVMYNNLLTEWGRWGDRFHGYQGLLGH
jgi:hypothetical protein